MQATSTSLKNSNTDSTRRIEINAASVLLGLSIVNKAKLQLKKPLAAANLTMNQWVVLKMLYLKCANTPSKLAKTIGADPTTISRHLDNLENRGLIGRKNNSNDRRVFYLQITPDGETIADQIYQYYPDVLKNLDLDISRNQQQIWNKIEQYMVDFIDE